MAYLALVDNALRAALSLEEISIAQEFFDVFPVELLGMPPNKPTELVIELVLGTTPISKAPYRMAFIERNLRLGSRII